MLVADVYRPEQWHDFFLMVGGGAAALAGLVFVALSINVRNVLSDSTHRSRAVGSLVGFTAVFMICALALMGDQDTTTIGIEWFVVSVANGAIYVGGYIQALRTGNSAAGLSWARLVPGTTCHIVQVIGSAALFFGEIWGLYAAAIGMVAFFGFLVSGAWLLMANSSQGQPNV
jgi:hypothetical protein